MKTLLLLDHARPGLRGYDTLIEVPSGWHLRRNKGALPTLVIAEQGEVTRERLLKAVEVGFSIDGKVYKVDDNTFDVPYPFDAAWEFTVKATGEPYP